MNFAFLKYDGAFGGHQPQKILLKDGMPIPKWCATVLYDNIQAQNDQKRKAKRGRKNEIFRQTAFFKHGGAI